MLIFTYGQEVDDDVEHKDDQGDDGEVDRAVVAHRRRRFTVFVRDIVHIFVVQKL